MTIDGPGFSGASPANSGNVKHTHAEDRVALTLQPRAIESTVSAVLAVSTGVEMTAPAVKTHLANIKPGGFTLRLPTRKPGQANAATPTMSERKPKISEVSSFQPKGLRKFNAGLDNLSSGFGQTTAYA